MKFGALVVCLKMGMQMNEKLITKYLERICISIGFVERRIKFMTEAIFDKD